MKSLISAKTAGYGMVFFLSLFVLVHLLVLTGLIPYHLVWGGRLKSHAGMVNRELLSIAINVLLLVAVANFVGLVKLWRSARGNNTFFWLLFLMFLLNTGGNLLSVSPLERMLFTPITAVLAFFSLRLALEKYPDNA